MLDLSLFKKLDAEQKHWMSLAIAGVIIADGIVDNEERNLVGNILRHMENLEKAEDMLSILRAKKVPGLPRITVKDRSLAVEMLFTATRIAIVDNNLAPKERDYLIYIGAVLSFPRDFFRELFNWAKQQAEVNQQQAEVNQLQMRLIKRGTTIDDFDASLIQQSAKNLLLRSESE